jgi:ribonuclease HI
LAFTNVTTSRLVENCQELLKDLGAKNKAILRLIPGHAGIEGNEKADELARAGLKGTHCGPELFCGSPKV